jgi:hypothetical protein
MLAFFLLTAACKDGSGQESIQECLLGGRVSSGADGSLVLDGCASLSLSAEVLGEGDISIRWLQEGESLQPVVEAGEEGGVFRALALRGPYSLRGDAQTRLWKQGYQSWWWSGVTDLEELRLQGGLPEVGGDGNGTSATEETPFTSWWVGLVGAADGDSILIGALSARKTVFWTAFSEEEAWAVWGGRGEQIQLGPREELRLDPVWIGSDADAFDLHRSYAAAAAERQGVSPREDVPPVGWASWYTYYEHIDEEIILGNLEKAADLAEEPGLEPISLFQIDDGWQIRWGEWEANEGFPSGMASLAERIKETGMVPGLWMAPFYVSTDSEIYSMNPGWWVLGPEGEPITYSNLGTGDYAIVDATHPEAGLWMGDQVAKQRRDGWEYLKLDFLYAGAQVGTRYQDVTAMEAYQIGMELLEEAAEGAYVLACGAPMLPSLGYADAFRTGADIGFGFDPGPRREYLRWQARSTAARSWQNGIWWWVDPDQLLVREPFSAAEAAGSVVANVVSGGSWLLGDELYTLPEDRLSLALREELAALRGEVSRPISPLSYPSGHDLGPVAEFGSPDDQVPLEWHLDSGHHAFLNLSDLLLEYDSPGGTELISGETATAESLRTLLPGQGELWLP